VVNSIAFDTLDRLKAFPGTISCGLVDSLPLHGGSQSNLFQIRGKTLPAAIAEREFGYRTATQGFFAAAGIPVLAGSIYRDWRGGQGIREAVISERSAQLWFPGENPIGHEFARPEVRNEPRWFRIVGVVGAVPAHATDTEPAAEVYVPWGATYWPLMNFVVRTERPRADVSRYVHEQIQKAHGSQLFSDVETFDERTAETRSGQRTAAMLVGGFALLAVGLAALGIFGLMAHETNRRTQEIGVRLALGAEPQKIAFDAVLRAVKPVALGLAAGLCVAWYASELVKSLLFGVAPHDAGSYAIAAGVIMMAAVLASLWPAVRAARIDPIRALRHD
jgi:putative ABC transport system permease protein